MNAKQRSCVLSALCVLLAFALPARLQALAVTVGVNLVNEPHKQTVAEQEATLAALQAAGVRVIRAGLPAGAGIAFAERAFAHGIRIVWLIGPSYAGLSWLQRPPGFVGFWSSTPGLSHADPDQFLADLAPRLQELESKGVVLAAFELGNEINWSNADIGGPGSGKILQETDLATDPEGQRVAAGYLRYLKLLAVLKNVRDHSILNRGTPVISAGLADLDQSASWLRSLHADAVNVDATLNFMRVHGLDRLVDGYGLHFYPSPNDPGTARGAADRLEHMRQNGLTQCQAAGGRAGKPCWITEWNFNGLNGGPCPVDDTKRATLIGEMLTTFRRLARDGRLKGLLFYTWQGQLHAKQEDPDSAFRCGELTSSGRLAIAPIDAR